MTFFDDGPPVLMLADATVIDPDSSDFSVGGQVVSHVGTFDDEDLFDFQNQGAGAGEISIGDGSLYFDDDQVGTYSRGTGSDTLTIDFASGATPCNRSGSAAGVATPWSR